MVAIVVHFFSCLLFFKVITSFFFVGFLVVDLRVIKIILGRNYNFLHIVCCGLKCHTYSLRLLLFYSSLKSYS